MSADPNLNHACAWNSLWKNGRVSCGVHKPKGCFAKTSLPVPTIGYLVLLGVLGVFATSSNFWTQFFHPIVLKGNLRRRSRWRIHFLANDFSSSHPNNFRKTISWQSFVKKDSVRSCLIELQSLLQSKVDVDPIHRVFMFFHFLCLYRARRGAFRSTVSGSLCTLFKESTGVKNTICLLLKFCPPGINPEHTMECKLIARPMWWMCSKKSFGINTLSCNEGSTRLRPEWP